MVVISIKVNDLCMAFITQGKHISTAEKFLKDNYNLTETQFTCVKSNIQKTLLPKFKTKWAAASRTKDRFIANNQDWLNTEYVIDFDNTEGSTPEISTPSGIQRGRPCKDYEESSESTKKRKATQMIRHSGIDQISFSYLQALRSIGEIKLAKIIEKVRYLSSELQDGLLNWLDNEGNDVLNLSKDEALAMYIDLDIPRNKYQLLKTVLDEKKCKILPTYKRIAEAKTECYPDGITVTDIKASVTLQDLLNHTVRRILKIDYVDISDILQMILYLKWGCDGSSGQAEYKQVLSGESEFISDANLFIASLVPLKLVNAENNQVIWENQTPSSNRYCRPISIEFTKETPAKTREVILGIENEVSVLQPTQVVISEQTTVSVKHELILTMIDGKVTQVLTDTPSSSACTICLAKPSEMNNLELVRSKQVRQEAYRFGLSTLHCWIRFMECILHISYNLQFKKWYARSEEEKKRKNETKKEIQRKFREELGLIVDKPRQGSGNSNDGNTARRFFVNYTCTANITGVNEYLIKRFYIILQTMASGKPIDAKKFGEYARKTAEYYVEAYGWYYMPASVHKVLIHGENIIKHLALLPLGQLSEDAQEARNKDYKHFRLHHARKCSRSSTNEDVFHTLMYTSDPYISSKRWSQTRKLMELDDEAKVLLQNLNVETEESVNNE